MAKLFNLSLGVLVVMTTFLCPSTILAQNTVTSGNWSDPTVWSGGAVPAAGGTVNVNNPLTIDQNLGPSGTWTFNSNSTDQLGGTAYTFNPTGGTTTISAGVTVTFEGTSNLNGAEIDVFGTLILGATTISNNLSNNIIIEPGGTLIINGNLTDQDNQGVFSINGALIVNGNLDCQTGSITVGGTGTINTTGTIASNGGSTVLGSTNDCTVGPCSGTTLACSFANAISPTGGAICSGSNTGTLTANSTGTTPTYQWQSSTTSSGSGFTDISGATSSTYLGTGLTQTTWYLVKKTVSGCTSSSSAVQFTVLPTAGGWIGGTSNDWSVSSNWCSGVPTSSTDVIISNASGISNMPSVLDGVSATCKSLTIVNTSPASSVTIAVSTTASLSISGNFTNNGTFTDNSTASAAGVKFVGSAAQTIAGSTANVFNNLTIANTSGATPAINITTNNVTVNSNLTMTSGLINLNGYTITLGTAAAATGTLTYTAKWFYGGNIERWFPTSAVAAGSDASLFPIGSSTDYRPIYFISAGLTGGSAAGGTIKVSHSSSSGTTAVSPTFVDNSGTVSIRSNSFWTVTTNNGITSSGNPFTMRTEGTGFGTVGALSDLRVTLANAIAPGTDGAHTAISLTNPRVSRSSISVANLSNSFYWGSINSVQTPLPIKLSSLVGEPALTGVQLKWTTLSEENFDYFGVERSDEGDAFYPIASVKGHGTAASTSNYSYIDEGAVGRNYYRLKNVDFDGHYDYSQVIVVDAGGVVLFPNPVTNHKLTIKLDSPDPGTLIMIDCTGQRLMNQNFSDSYLQVVLPESIQSGIYFIKLQQGSSQKTIRVAVVNN